MQGMGAVRHGASAIVPYTTHSQHADDDEDDDD